MTRDEVVEYFQKEISKISSVGSAPSVEVLLPILDEVVQRSLARYAADAIGRPDFALGTAGAVIVTSLTSQTLATASDSFIGKWLGQKIVRGWGPYYALTPGTMPGQCWSMEGSSGSIGLQLARPAVPTDFTIDHVSPDLILDSVHGLESAPKDVELWAVLDVAAFRELNLDLQDNRLPVLSRTREDGSVSLNAGLLLSVQRFDPRKGSIQTFPVLPEAVKAIRSNKVVPNKVLLRILSNWGHPDYTCLYRLRIHGKDV
ncbi:hypothetical protein DFJ73DRAFT_630150 [Zopfochytrium polystomum]|nr:hypothetical protein DFJ73DRAFT_630150 [Zopfochytrium polystomum]